MERFHRKKEKQKKECTTTPRPTDQRSSASFRPTVPPAHQSAAQHGDEEGKEKKNWAAKKQ
jgi:hypothetical protein